MPTHSSTQSLFRGLIFVAAGILLGVAIMATLRAVSAFTEPASAPPTGNVPAPVNVSSTRQDKSGELGILNLFLGIGGSEGSIFNTDIIQGFNDLRLFGNSAKNVPVYLEGNPVVINNDAGTGNVGIGIIPENRLHVRGDIAIETNGPGGSWNLAVDGAGVLRINANEAVGGNTHMVIDDNSGNVGINTTSPGQKLDVAGGYVRSDTGLCIGGDCRTSWPSTVGVGVPVYACPNRAVDPRGDCGLNDQTCYGQFSTESTCFWYPGPDCDVAVKVTESCTLAGRLIAP